MRISIIGCGTVAANLCEGIGRGEAGKVEIVSVFDSHADRAERLARRFRSKVAASVGEIASDQSVSLVVEAASQAAVSQYAATILNSGKHLVILSVGALTESRTQELARIAEAHGVKVHLPSGAIVGIDGLKASSVTGISSVTVEFRKPPSNFRENLADFVAAPSAIASATTVYEGSASEAAKLFPKSVNVSITAGLAGIGPEKTRVRIVADPSVDRNIITLTVAGEAGEIVARTANVMTEGPRTSVLTVASVLSLLRDLGQSLVIGG